MDFNTLRLTGTASVRVTAFRRFRARLPEVPARPLEGRTRLRFARLGTEFPGSHNAVALRPGKGTPRFEVLI